MSLLIKVRIAIYRQQLGNDTDSFPANNLLKTNF